MGYVSFREGITGDLKKKHPQYKTTNWGPLKTHLISDVLDHSCSDWIPGLKNSRTGI